MSTSCSPSRWSVPIVTGMPLTCAEVRPWAEIRRVMMSGVIFELSAEDRLDLGPQPGVFHLEDRGGPGLGLARADQLGRGFPAQDQRERREQEALARPGLTRPGAEAPLQLDPNVLDQRQVLNRELAKHE